jgi:Arc/MetJ family transcription regulator
MNYLAYWTRKLQEAERELDAATKRADVNAAARRLMRVKGGGEAAWSPRASK